VDKRFSPLAARAQVLELGSSPDTFVIHRQDVLSLARFPRHEEALEMGLLVRMSVVNLSSRVYFISHKWAQNEPDPANSALIFAQKRLQTSDYRDYIWFDYSCVPQVSGSELRNQHLLAIPRILDRAFVLVPGEQLRSSAYHQSVWCQLERLTERFVEDKTDCFRSYFGDNLAGEMTIFDPKDLFSVLPGFLHLLLSSAKYNINYNSRAEDICMEESRRKLLGEILELFLRFCEEEMNI
jgi:hypothetical protein